MLSVEILLLGLALAMDAGVVSFALGLLGHEVSTTSQKIGRGFLIALTFGLFQFFMLWLGSYGGFLFTFSSYGYLSHFMVASIFFLIGVKFFTDSLKQEQKDLEWGLLPLLILAVATSIDALAAGVSLGALPLAWLSALHVGMITVLISASFYTAAQFFKRIPERWMLRLSSMIFFLLALEIVMEFAFRKGSA